MKRMVALLLAVAAAPAGASAQVPAGGRAIVQLTYETGPCFGTCPVYRVTVRRDGTGIFEGRRYTTFTGQRRITVTTAQFRALARHLAPLRPLNGEIRYAGEACRRLATDMPSAEVTWFTEGETQQRLHFYYGCDMGANRDIAERLRRAPGLLPIGDLIGARR